MPSYDRERARENATAARDEGGGGGRDANGGGDGGDGGASAARRPWRADEMGGLDPPGSSAAAMPRSYLSIDFDGQTRFQFLERCGMTNRARWNARARRVAATRRTIKRRTRDGRTSDERATNEQATNEQATNKR